MKKIVLNISESTYEKLRFEAIHEMKSIQEVIQDRFFNKQFHEEVQQAFDSWMEAEVYKIIGGN